MPQYFQPGTVRRQRHLRIVSDTNDQMEHNQSREELSIAWTNCLSKNSDTNSPTGRSYSSTICHPAKKRKQKERKKEKGKKGLILFGFAQITPVCSSLCLPTSVPAQCLHPTQLPARCRGHPEKTLCKEKGQGRKVCRDGRSKRSSQEVSTRTPVCEGGHSMHQPKWQLIRATGLAISTSDL